MTHRKELMRSLHSMKVAGSRMEFVVIEFNDLTPLSVNSIKEFNPDAEVTVVPVGPSAVASALSVIEDKALVMKSGVVFRGTERDIPIDKMNDYPIAISELAVFADHPNCEHIYEMMNSSLAGGVYDLSIFLLNPKLWNAPPKADTGFLKDMKRLKMPRYMNHREDIAVGKGIPAHICLQYGALGLSALTLNYVECIMKKEANVGETMAYLFDGLEPYVGGLDQESSLFIQGAADKTRQRVGKIRDAYANMQGVEGVIDVH